MAKVYVRVSTNAEPFILAVRVRRTRASVGEGLNGNRAGGHDSAGRRWVVEALRLLSVFTEAELSRTYDKSGGSSKMRMVCREAVEVVSIRQSSTAFSALRMRAKALSDRTMKSVR
jgi:hypothetical protein